MNPEHWKEARWNVFTSKAGGEAFGSIAYPQDVWSNDPYDEESIHAEARQVFSDLIEVAADGARGERRGRIFLLQGNAGSGKTHLMGAFRREVERRSAGYFAYAQMSTELPLRKYLLRRIIDCLDRFGTLGGSSGLLRLSDRLVERPGIPAEEREALRNHEDYSEPLQSIRARLLDDLKQAGASKALHGDFVTALLALQRRDGNAVSAATKYFRGDPLGVEDLRWLCSPHGLSGVGEPEILLDWLLRAVREFGGTQGSAFVLCIDQLEDLSDPSAPQQQRFPELVLIMRSLVENHPGLVIVVACLEDYYSAMRTHLRLPDIDRLENNPKPVWLKTERTADEAVALVRKRLEVLYADSGISAGVDADSLFPFSRQELAKLQGLRPRAILDACYEAWRGSRCTGELPVIKVAVKLPIDSSLPHLEIDWPHKWNDFRTSWAEPVPQNADDLAASLAAGVNALAGQLRVSLRADNSADLVHLNVTPDALIAAICNAPAQGGRLSNQLTSLQHSAAAANRKPVAIRNTEFAKSPKSQIAKLLGTFVAGGGRRIIFPESDWRALRAWQAFAGRHGNDAGFSDWAAKDRPLAEVQGLKELVDLDRLLAAAGESGTDPGPLKVNGNGASAPDQSGPASKDQSILPPPSPAQVLDPDRVELGTKKGIRSEAVFIPPSVLTQHLAVLGVPGSGKTTLALTLIEGLLLRGIPAILVDRKGDLSRYADAASKANLEGPLATAFHERVEVALYTPGNGDGRPLSISVLPQRTPEATSQEIQLQAEEAAEALGAMIGYTGSPSREPRRAALRTAIRVLLELDAEAPTLDRLIDLIDSEDPSLLQAIGRLDRKHLRGLVQDLDSFRQLNTRLLATGAEPLEAERLLGLGSHATPGRTRLTVISTKFIGKDPVIQFWVAQLMMELARFGSNHPSGNLQAVIMLDEADLYLPATGKPASKQPIENGLRRFRSQGIGLILATQNPGDFDYRCRENIQTWLVGRVKETRSLDKLRPAFGDNANALDRLVQHATGEFCLVQSDAFARFQAHRNLLRTEQMSDAEILRAAREGARG